MVRYLAVVVASIIVACALFAVWSRWRLRRLARERLLNGVGFQTFASDLRGLGDEDVLRVVYDYLSAYAAPGFPVLASDVLGDIYGLAAEDLDDAICEIATKCGADLNLPAEGEALLTVADVVALIQASRG